MEPSLVSSLSLNILSRTSISNLGKTMRPMCLGPRWFYTPTDTGAEPFFSPAGLAKSNLGIFESRFRIQIAPTGDPSDAQNQTNIKYFR
jgi:hypothetical protein